MAGIEKMRYIQYAVNIFHGFIPDTQTRGLVTAGLDCKKICLYNPE